MLLIGSHVSFSKDEQLIKSVREAISYKSNTFMFYTGAPQNSNRSPIDNALTSKALDMIKNSDIEFSNVIVHAPYIINIANKLEISKYRFSIDFLKNEIKRCKLLGIKYMILHPGSHVGQGIDIGIRNIVDALNIILDDNNSVTILLETMAGKGTEVGSKFEELKKIIDGVNKKEMIGVCIDTCHLNDSGYDLSNFDDVLDEFDNIIGIDKIKCIHINDSKNKIASHKDRHENIGFGTIGFDNIMKVVYSDRLNEDIPRILETPYVDGKYSPWKYEIEMIRNKTFDPNLIEKIKEGN